MEQQSSTSKVTVEYFDPHDVYKLIAPGLVPRLPLKNLHWQSHVGPLRSIDTLHVELTNGSDGVTSATASLRQSGSTIRDDGFQTQSLGARPESREGSEAQGPTKSGGVQRRHQIPGLRTTPYLKVLLVRCDDNDSYKGTVRSEIREWIKTQTPPTTTSKKSINRQEKHAAFEWLIVHVVIPSTVASTQPRTTSSSSSSNSKSETPPVEKGPSRWRPGSTPLLEKLKSDFNGSTKGSINRVCQIRIGVNDVPYELLPRVVPAVPTGYSETEQDAENAWNELMSKFRSLILSSFDTRVTQYEEDIKERDGQRTLPGWNFCTFFILKEGLARGFESVGLVEDALVGYDELSVGLDVVLQEQAETGQPESRGGSLLSYTKELHAVARKAVNTVLGRGGEEEEAVDLQSTEVPRDPLDDIPISSTKKAYRDMILENKVSVFDFRCYIFARQIALLLRLSNALSSREELLAKLKDQQDAIMTGVAPLAPPPPRQDDAPENLLQLAEICRRALSFIPSISQIIRQDIMAAFTRETKRESISLDAALNEAVDNLVASFSFSVAQQILAQTASKALPIPPSPIPISDASEPKASIPEPKTMMHPARLTSLNIRPQSMVSSRPLPSPNVFSSGTRRASVAESNLQNSQFLKTGLEELAAKRAELHMLSRSILTGMGSKRGWGNGWPEAPIVGDFEVEMVDINLNDETPAVSEREAAEPSLAGIDSPLLRTALENSSDFYRLYEILTDKAVRHYTVANYDYAVKAAMADLAVLKMQMEDYRTAASFFYQATPFFGESGWTLLELSMLVMYTRCLEKMDSSEDYVRVTLKLLTKSCAAEKERLEQRRAPTSALETNKFPDMSSMEGVVEKLFRLSSSLSTEARVPLDNFFTNIEFAGTPEYHENNDSCSIHISLHSLLPEDVSIDELALRLAPVDGSGSSKEVWFKSSGGGIILSPGGNTITLQSNTIIPGKYTVAHLRFSSGKLLFQFDRNSDASASRETDIFRNPAVSIFLRSSALDVNLTASKHTALDKNNSLDLTLSTGWNSLKSCQITVKPATGGLRLLTTNATFVDSDMEFVKPPSTGIFSLAEVEENTIVTIRFPYSTEQDVGELLARLEVTYVTTSNTTYFLGKTTTLPISLALGVNVQDVFKHEFLLPRFSVATASSGPLYLYKSELLESELFESTFGIAPSQPIIVFPRQPATLMYKIKRKIPAKVGKRQGRVMYLKLHYSQLRTQMEQTIVTSALSDLDEDLHQWSRALKEVLIRELQKSLQLQEMERAALVGRVSTDQLRSSPWQQHFEGLGKEAAAKISAFFDRWTASHSSIPMITSNGADASSILIPVEIPSLPVVHTADIRFPQEPSLFVTNGASPTAHVNQILPATLNLRWTRTWDTESPHGQDTEYSYEVNGASDTWLIGGRRKGHFVIPASEEEKSSTPATEAEIPLILIPQREGWLPYPTVEIREIGDDGKARDTSCEVDWRNIGETVRVISERKGITLSLDASGPGGGPLVLESEGMRGGVRT